jgi:hypothetical protein
MGDTLASMRSKVYIHYKSIIGSLSASADISPYLRRGLDRQSAQWEI